MYPRVVKKIVKARRYGFKNYRYFRRTGRRARSNRIFRRFLRRRAIKPELKHIEVNWSSGDIGRQAEATVAVYTQSITPLTINLGVNDGQRVGSEVKFIKVDMRLCFKDDSNRTTPLSAPVFNTYPIRVIVWTPRRPYTQAAAHIESLEWEKLPDYDQVTVHLDRTIMMSPGYIAEATSNDPNGGPYPGIAMIYKKFKFPRNVKLTNAASDLDPQRDVLYCTLSQRFINYAGFNAYCNSKTWYYDA